MLMLLSGQRAQTIAAPSPSVGFDGVCACSFEIVELLKACRPGHLVDRIQLQACDKDPTLCVVAMTKEYSSRTRHLHKDSESQLLLSYKAPHKQVEAATISRWVLCIMAQAGVDMGECKSHSARAASTSAARVSVPIETVLAAGGWTSAATFAKFYDKPIVTQQSFGGAVLERFGNRSGVCWLWFTVEYC